MWRLREVFLQKSFFCPISATALAETLIVVNSTSCSGHYCTVGGNKTDQRTFNLQHLLKQSTRDLGTKLSSWWLLSSPGWDWLLSSVQKENNNFKKDTQIFISKFHFRVFHSSGAPCKWQTHRSRQEPGFLHFKLKDFFSIKGQRNYQTTWLKKKKKMTETLHKRAILLDENWRCTTYSRTTATQEHQQLSIMNFHNKW